MSEKRAKEQRRAQGGNTGHDTRQPIIFKLTPVPQGYQITFQGVPNDLDSALNVLSVLTSQVVKYFVKAAADGKMKDGKTEQSRIILPTGVIPGKMQ